MAELEAGSFDEFCFHDDELTGEAMRLRPRTLGISAGLVAASTFIVCGLLVAVVPGAASSVFSWVFHINLTGMTRPISMANFLGGLLAFSIFVALVVGGTAGLYNRLSDGRRYHPV